MTYESDRFRGHEVVVDVYGRGGDAERGYVVFAPQNPYIGGDRYRTIQRLANPLGYSLFSVIVRQHQRILQWLGKLPLVIGTVIENPNERKAARAASGS